MTTPDTDDTDGTEDQPTPPRFPSMPDWVEGWLGNVVSNRFTSDHLWCAQWWNHPEVCIRFESLWRGWEAARVSDDALAMSSWWVYHFDAHWRAITSDTGPLYLCTPEQHTSTPQIKHIAPPPGWFTPTSTPEDDEYDDDLDWDGAA